MQEFHRFQTEETLSDACELVCTSKRPKLGSQAGLFLNRRLCITTRSPLQETGQGSFS
jgi:hypothetical protein